MVTDRKIPVPVHRSMPKNYLTVKHVISGIKTSQKHRFKTGQFGHNAQLCA